MLVRGLKSVFSFAHSRVVEAHFSPDSAMVRIALDRRRKPRCPRCDAVAAIEQKHRRKARDLPFLAMAQPTLIEYEAAKARCPKCGARSWIVPEGIDAARSITQRLMLHAVRLARNLAISTVASLLSICESSVRRWDKAFLKEHLPEPDLDNLRILLIDEKAIGKRHSYVTVVLNGQTGELLHCHAGKKKKSLMAFFDKLSEAQKQRIEVACVDRAGAYVSCVEETLPDANIAFDKFHLVQNFNAEIDDIRREEWNRARTENDDEGLRLIKGQRYNLLRRAEKNSDRQQSRLEELLAGNQTLNISYILLDDFREVLSETSVAEADAGLRAWLEAALACRVLRVEKFARSIGKRTREVLNAVRYQVTNGRIEGFNNLISRVLHRGCGYRDVEYLKLKLRQASLPSDLLHSLPQR